jgi:Tfp pilus assembly protein FimV
MSPFRLAVWPFALIAAVFTPFACALGLGEISLHSALAEPLKADIELLDARNLNSDEIKVRLAPSDVFARAGVERPAFLAGLSFLPVLEQGRHRIRVTSTAPVKEPYLNFIIELTLPGGQLLREYTLLLDPPLYQPALSAQPQAQSEAPRVTRSQPTRAETIEPLPAAAQGKRYRIMPGDSLWSISGRVEVSPSTSREALMADLYRLNPAAFINGDRNRLRVGAELLLPDSVESGASAVSTAARPAAPTQDRVEQPQALSQAELPAALAEAPAGQDQSLVDVLRQLEAQVLSLQAQMDEQNRLLAEAQSTLAQRQAAAAVVEATVEEATAVTGHAEQPAQPKPQTVPVQPVAMSPPMHEPSAGSSWLIPLLGLLSLLVALLWYRRRAVAVTSISEPRQAQAKRAEASFPDINPFQRDVPVVTEMSLDEYLDRAPAAPAAPAASVALVAAQPQAAPQPQPAQLLDDMLASLPDDLDALTITPPVAAVEADLRERLNEALASIDRGEVEQATRLLISLLDQSDSDDRRFIGEQLARIA